MGDRDFATHIRRTSLLRAGRSYTQVVGALAEALRIRAHVLPKPFTIRALRRAIKEML